MSHWESYLRTRFPGYLLPDAGACPLTVEQAQKFLETISGRADLLRLLRALGALRPASTAVAEFVAHIEAAVRALASTTTDERRRWRGGFHGRLDVPATQRLHQQGERTAFQTRTRRRTFHLPENILLRSVCEKLLALLAELRHADVLPAGGWGTDLRAAEGTLRRLLSTTVLMDVPAGPLSVSNEAAALSSRLEIHREALRWLLALRAAMEGESPRAIATAIAQGALLPLKDHTRFELAVALRLCEALQAALDLHEPGAWRREPGLVLPSRRDIMCFSGPDERRVRLFYNNAILPSGACDEGASHYLQTQGRLRPDLVLTTEVAGERVHAAVIEIKHSDSRDYLVQGFQEAVLYRWEYAAHLTGWPKAILVASSDLPSGVREGDDVVACDWRHWPPAQVARGLLATVLAT